MARSVSKKIILWHVLFERLITRDIADVIDASKIFRLNKDCTYLTLDDNDIGIDKSNYKAAV